MSAGYEYKVRGIVEKSPATTKAEKAKAPAKKKVVKKAVAKKKTVKKK